MKTTNIHRLRSVFTSAFAPPHFAALVVFVALCAASPASAATRYL